MKFSLLPLSFFSRFLEGFVFFFLGSILFNIIFLFVIPGIIELFQKNKEKNKNKQKNKVNKFLVAIIIIISFCLASSINTLYKFYNIYLDLETSYAELEKSLEKTTETQPQDYSFNSLSQIFDSFYDESSDIYGKVYHKLSNPCALCRFRFLRAIQNPELIDSITLCDQKSARSNGYSPCSVCY